MSRQTKPNLHLDDGRSTTAKPTPQQIEALAYQLWLERGGPLGSDQEDWYTAEGQLKNAYREQADWSL